MPRRFRFIGSALVVLAALALLAALEPRLLGPASLAQPRRLSVVATTTQIADMARHVAGNRADVVSILPLNADAHDYEPTTDDARRIAQADLVLQNGLGLEKFVADLARNRRSGVPLVTVTDGITPRRAEADHAEPDHGAVDPHVWFAVPNAITMTLNIRDALIAVDPAGADTYGANAAAYTRDLQQLDADIFEQIGQVPPEQRRFVSNHDAFGYYCDRYGLTFVGSVIPSLDSEAEPSAADVAKLIQAIRTQNVKAIFVEAALNPTLAERIARETGVKTYVLYGDSLGPPGSGADTYIGMMRWNTETIVKGLLGG